MKKTTHLALLALLLCAFPIQGHARQPRTTDVSPIYSGEPANTGLGSTIGGGIGRTAMLTPEFGFRGDLSVLLWNRPVAGTSLAYNRVPGFLGVRYYPGASFLFAEAGGEISKDNSVFTGGGALGAGLELPIGESSYYVGISARYHIIVNPYLTAAATIGWKY